jgi:hypothetical protein
MATEVLPSPPERPRPVLASSARASYPPPHDDPEGPAWAKKWFLIPGAVTAGLVVIGIALAQPDADRVVSTPGASVPTEAGEPASDGTTTIPPVPNASTGETTEVSQTTGASEVTTATTAEPATTEVAAPSSAATAPADSGTTAPAEAVATTAAPTSQATTTVAPTTTAAGPACDPNYSGCVPVASDVDCAGGSGNGPEYVQGPVQVVGSDIYGLDNDSDGVGCEP